MPTADHFIQSYREGFAPWELGRADWNLVYQVSTLPIAPCKALEIGCGTGNNAIWLAQAHFAVVAVDASDIAIEKAKEKAEKSQVSCGFFVQDFLSSHVPGAPFGFAFDRGCFHTADSDEERTKFAKQVHRHLVDRGLWLSLVGNADEKRVGQGPPRRTARQIVDAVEPYFEILSLVSGHFDSNLPEPPRIWVCLLRKRQAD